MQFSNSQILPFIGISILLFFIALSYFNNHIFLDKIVLCSLILGMVFFVKMRSDNNGHNQDSDNTTYA
jgi:uncharacterized membrane protein